MDNILKLLGMEVKEKRKKLGLTQEKLAEITNISLPQISKIERGKANITVSSLEPIANALKTSIAELICGSQVNQAHEKLQLELISTILSLNSTQIIQVRSFIDKNLLTKFN